MNSIVHILSIDAIGVSTLFFIMWLIHLYLRNAAVVDIGWGLGFIIICVIDILLGARFTPRNALFLAIVALWGLRITFFLIKRISLEKKEDRRYQQIRQAWKTGLSWKFLFFFEFQALLQMIIFLPFLNVTFNPARDLSGWEIAGIILSALAILGEALADDQLHAFKANPLNKGKTCDLGLWQYSRHPNYFFEWLVWMGFFIFALGSHCGWFAFISPLIMYLMVRYVSGVPWAEAQSLESRGDNYRRYQQTTSVFFPMPKRII